MNTLYNTCTSYVDCISEAVLDELVPCKDQVVKLHDIRRPSIIGYGIWRLEAEFEVNGRRFTLIGRTHDEDLKLHFVDQSEWNNVSEPSMTEGDAAEAILRILINANEDEFIQDGDTSA